jgi:hypothetical protein
MMRMLRRLPRAWIQNLVLALVSSALALAAGEWFLRRYLPVGGFLYRLDPLCHYTLAPKARTLFVHGPRNGGGIVLVTVNSDGFRGDELRRGGDPRIVVYGDSCVEADYSPLAETFTRRLEVRLSSALGRPVETVNAGVNGYGPDQAFRRFQEDARSLRPIGIVFTVFADNDFGDLIRNRLFRLEGEDLVEAGGVLGESVRQMFDPEGRDRGFLLYERLRNVLRRSRRAHRATPEAREENRRTAMARYLQLSDELCRREYEETVRKGNPVISDLVKDHYDADVSFSPGSDAAAYKRRLFEAVLRRVRAAALGEHVRVLVLVVPSPIDVCDGYEIRVDPRQYPGYDRRRLTTEATGAARRAGLDVLDLFDPFQRAGAADLYYHPPGEDHWNAGGQDLAARLVSERVMAEGWLVTPTAAPPAADLGTTGREAPTAARR